MWSIAKKVIGIMLGVLLGLVIITLLLIAAIAWPATSGLVLVICVGIIGYKIGTTVAKNNEK